jgi:starch synthase
LGNVFLEAQAAGCAVVATRVGGIPEIVDEGVTGVLVDADGVRQAVDAIARLLSDGDRMRELGSHAQRNAEKYDWKLIANRYAQTYKSVTLP